jgi:glycosyltransferase involved in cell wall biosynthesis
MTTMTKNANKTVSVIVPCYNGSATIADCLSSIITQDYSDIEVVVVDNGSVDDSQNIARRVLSEGQCEHKILSEPRKGVTFARNLGIKFCSGRYICFLDVDDKLLEKSISQRVTFMERNKLSITFAAYNRVSKRKCRLIKVKKDVTFNEMLNRNHLPNLTAMYDSEILGKHFQKHVGHEDFEMWLRLIKLAKVAKSSSCDVPIAEYNNSIAGLSSNKVTAAIWHWKILSLHVKNPFRRLLHFSHYAFHSIASRL